MHGGVLEPISFDIDANKYFDQRTEEDIANHYQSLDDRYRELINNILRKDTIKKVKA
jgi:hypothetical protein